jgi:hypothetical protein
MGGIRLRQCDRDAFERLRGSIPSVGAVGYPDDAGMRGDWLKVLLKPPSWGIRPSRFCSHHDAHIEG